MDRYDFVKDPFGVYMPWTNISNNGDFSEEEKNNIMEMPFELGQAFLRNYYNDTLIE